jgi:hypothetical protein
VAPCRTYHAGGKSDEQIRQFLEFLRAKPSLSWAAGCDLREIKSLLQDFNSKSKNWK